MEVLLIPFAIIAFFLYLPFGLAKLTESENRTKNHFSIGWKAAGYDVKGYLSTSMFPLIGIAWSFGQWESDYISAIIFLVSFYTLLYINLKVRYCFNHFRKFMYITHGYALFGVFVCIFMFNFTGGILLIACCLYWFVQSLKFYGKYVQNAPVQQTN